MEKLLNIDIDNLSKEDLLKLKDKINEIIKPYNNKTAEIYNKIREIEKNEYLANRGIKNYPILNDLISALGNTYKDVIIDIDEFLGIKRYSSIRIYNEVEKACNNYDVDFTYELADIVKDFLINNNIVKPQYEIYCPACSGRISIFSLNPTSETFIKDFKEQHDYYNIDEDVLYCDNCNEEIDLSDKDNICQSDFYKIIEE